MTGDYHVPWEHVEEASEMLTEMADPDWIVGITRGGLPLAVILSHRFDVPMSTIEASHYDGDERQETVEVGTAEPIALTEGTVLIVDDIADTGDTLAAVDSIVDSMTSPHVDVESATMFTREDTEPKPDHVIFATDDWVVFPWEEA